MLYEITINLLPGIADKERKLREKQKKMLQLVMIVAVDIIVAIVFLLLMFHNIALTNNLKLLNKLITDVNTEIATYTKLENDYKDFQNRITIIDNIIKDRKDWQPLIDAIGQYTLKNVQLTRSSINTSSIVVNGIAPTILDLEKQKEAYKLTAITQDYTVGSKDTWNSIAKEFGFTTEDFVVLHNIDPTIPPSEGKTIKIQKPIFQEVLVTSLSDVSVNNPVNFQFSLPLEKGVI